MVELSVVVPTYRRPKLLAQSLRSLAAQDADPARFEVVVVDDGSGDDTTDVLVGAASTAPNLRWHALTRNAGPAAARNRAIREASAPLVLFLDDDVVAPPTLVSTHLRLHAERRGRSGVLGRVEWAPWLRVTPFMRWLDASGLQFAYDTWLRPGRVDPPYAAFYTANLSMPRALLLEVGGFDERFPYPAYEDIELAWRLAAAGFELDYCPEALAYHARPIDLATYRRRMAMVAESAAVLRRVQPEFPVDDVSFDEAWVRRRDRPGLRLRAALARVTGDDAARRRYYRAEIAAAYADGHRRGEERVAQSGGVAS